MEKDLIEYVHKDTSISVCGIIATDLSGGIGLKGKLPWGRIERDLHYFRDMTRYHTCLMGSTTWASLPKRLPYRRNVVLSSRPQKYQGASIILSGDPEDCLQMLYDTIDLHEIVFVCGGAKVFEQYLPYMDCVSHTTIHDNYAYDTHFDYTPLYNNTKWQVVKRTSIEEKDTPKIEINLLKRKG